VSAALALPILLGAGGLLLLAAAGLVPYEWIRHWLDRFAADGSADAYTAAIHQGIVRRLRYAGLGLLALGIVLHRVRHRLAAGVRAVAAGAVALLRDGTRSVQRMWSAASTGHRVALLLIVSVGIGARLWLLGVPMRYDESFTFLNYARDPLLLGLTRYDLPNNHLFHTALVHVAYGLLGDAPWALRMPAFLGGVLTIPATYLAVRVLYGRDAALLASAVVATSMAAIEGSTNARGYSIVTLLFLALLCLGAYLRRTDNVAGWALFPGLGALALYTIPTGVYAVAAVAGWLLLEAWTGDVTVARRRFVLRLAGAVAVTMLLTALLYAPILIRTDLVTLLATNPVVAIKVRPIPWGDFLVGNAGKVVEAWRRWASDWAWPIQAVWLAGIVTALVSHRRVGRTPVPFPAGFVVGALPILLAQRVVPPARIWVFLWPIVAGMGAAGLLHLIGRLIGWLRSRRPSVHRSPGLAPALALLLIVAGVLSLPARSGVYTYNRAEFPGAEEAVTTLAPRLAPDDRILVVGMSLVPFLYYSGRHGLPYLTHVYDYALEGWAALRDAKRIFVVMIDDRQTLARVLTEAQLADRPPPVEIAALDGGRIYLVSRD
jgi:hypothetical protein